MFRSLVRRFHPPLPSPPSSSAMPCAKVKKALMSQPWPSRAISSHARMAVVAQEGHGNKDVDLLSDYALFRRSLCGGLAYKALLVDAAGTLIVPAQPAAKVYADIGRKYGMQLSEDEILRRYRWAYAQPWSRTRLRYEDDARPFWQYIVEQATGCKDPAYLEELYQYYTTAEAWKIADPDAGRIFEALRRAGVKVCVVSNFDTRLRPLLNALHCNHWFDALAISAEVGAEKPNPAIFYAALDLLGVKAEEAVHVGDDRRNDIWGARDAGCDAWLWGENVTSFSQVAEKIGVQVT